MKSPAFNENFNRVLPYPNRIQSLLAFVVIFLGCEIGLFCGAAMLFGKVHGAVLTAVVGLLAIWGWSKAKGTIANRLTEVITLLTLSVLSGFVFWLCGYAFNRVIGLNALYTELVIAEGALLYAALMAYMFYARLSTH